MQSALGVGGRARATHVQSFQFFFLLKVHEVFLGLLNPASKGLVRILFIQ